MHSIRVMFSDIEECEPPAGTSFAELLNSTAFMLITETGATQAACGMELLFTCDPVNREITFRSENESLLNAIDLRVGETAGEIYTIRP